MVEFVAALDEARGEHCISQDEIEDEEGGGVGGEAGWGCEGGQGKEAEGLEEGPRRVRRDSGGGGVIYIVYCYTDVYLLDEKFRRLSVCVWTL